MKAIQLVGFGGPDMLELAEVPAPEIGPDDVLIRVKASGVNFADTAMRVDRYAITPPVPSILGSEVAGIVEGIGANVTGIAIGQRVAGSAYAAGQFFGGYAELAACPADYVTPIPDALTFEQAVALMVQGLTAYHLLLRAPVAGKRILVSAAAGGVGSLLVQLAKRAGAAQIIAAASTGDKRDFAMTLGADAAVDYTAPGWSDEVRALTDGGGADIIFESVGGTVVSESLKALAPLGQLVIYGSLNILEFNLGIPELLGLIFQNQSVTGFATVPLMTVASLQESQADMFALAAANALRVTIGGVFPLERAGDAHRALEGRQTRGKVVLIP
jgi:NADPH2:quinone reductase